MAIRAGRVGTIFPLWGEGLGRRCGLGGEHHEVRNRQHANAHLGPKGRRCAPIVGARNYSQPHSQEARVGRLVPIVIVTAIDIFYRLGDLVDVLPDIVQRGDRHCVELTE